MTVTAIERIFDGLFSLPMVLGFFLTLVRLAGVFAFVPVPGLKSVVDPARILLVLGLTLALYPVWPHPPATTGAATMTAWVVAEAALGIGIGIAVGFAVEAFMVGAQMIGLQAGYSFASTIDPSTQADSTVLVLFAQTVAAVLFFAMGLDRDVLRIFARSLETCPPGTFTLTRSATEAILLAGSTMFSTGLRLALPVMAVMLMVDISVALLGRVNAQLQLMTIAFPVKMVIGLGLLAWISVLLPSLMRGGSAAGAEAMKTLITR
ncbi:MAG TPA: flagellar biosynthetic protein FliR [Bryobacteraceae bacterium]|nr:flagellar biosynthetic protein FliR [Bryobacteraceae bacterium]